MMMTHKELKNGIYTVMKEQVAASIPDSIPEEPNYIIEILLGLEDSTIMERELHLGENGEMKILKNGQVALSGNWKNLDRHVLILTANGQFWNLEVLSKNEDSLVLKSGGYQFIDDLKMVLKH
jgi:hypothetical protein